MRLPAESCPNGVAPLESDRGGGGGGHLTLGSWGFLEAEWEEVAVFSVLCCLTGGSRGGWT